MGAPAVLLERNEFLSPTEIGRQSAFVATAPPGRGEIRGIAGAEWGDTTLRRPERRSAATWKARAASSNGLVPITGSPAAGVP